jgi:hypothetical protein
MPAIYLDDGYTLDGLVPARLGYPAVRFSPPNPTKSKYHAVTNHAKYFAALVSSNTITFRLS